LTTQLSTTKELVRWLEKSQVLKYSITFSLQVSGPHDLKKRTLSFPHLPGVTEGSTERSKWEWTTLTHFHIEPPISVSELHIYFPGSGRFGAGSFGAKVTTLLNYRKALKLSS